MANIPAVMAEAREDAAYALFASRPGLTVAAANDTLYATDGIRMNLNRLCIIRRAAIAGSPRPTRRKNRWPP